jgi:hypothetical protein
MLKKNPTLAAAVFLLVALTGLSFHSSVFAQTKMPTHNATYFVVFSSSNLQHVKDTLRKMLATSSASVISADKADKAFDKMINGTQHGAANKISSPQIRVCGSAFGATFCTPDLGGPPGTITIGYTP